MKRFYRKYSFFVIAALLLTACGKKEPESTANMQTPAAVIPDGGSSEAEENESTAGDEGETGDQKQPDEEYAEPTAGTDEDMPAAVVEQEGNFIIDDLSSEEWEQIAQNGAILKFHDGVGGYVYVDPETEVVYHQEIHTHERAGESEVSWFRPHYSSRSDATMFADSIGENGEQRYDVYVGEELLISGLRIDAEEMHKGDDGYIADYELDVCYDAETREVLFLTYHKDPEKQEEGFMIYHAFENDDCLQPLRFYPVLTGELYQDLVIPDWIWSALLTPEAIYYDTLPVKRIDVETGEVTEWGLTEAEYMETTGIENPSRWGDSKVAGGGYILTTVKYPDPAFGDVTEVTLNTFLIYTKDGELVCVIPDVCGGW